MEPVAISWPVNARVTEGPYKGLTGGEPKYEQLGAWGPQIGNNELGATVMLASEVNNERRK